VFIHSFTNQSEANACVDFNVQTTLGAMWYDELTGSSRSEFVVSVAVLNLTLAARY